MTSKEKESKHYHHIDKGCDLEDITVEANPNQEGPRHYLKMQYCKTHKVRCCRCGWEFSHHFSGVKLYGTSKN